MLSLVMSWEHDTSEMRCVTIRKKITFNTYDYRNSLTLNAPNVAKTVDYIGTSGVFTNSVQTVAKLTQRVSMKCFTDKKNRYLRSCRACDLCCDKKTFTSLKQKW